MPFVHSQRVDACPVIFTLGPSTNGDLKTMTVVLQTTQAVTMTSREIADLLESRHDKVKQSIDRLVTRGLIAKPPVGDGEKSSNGVVEQLYFVGKRDSYIVVAQLSPEFTAQLVDRWQELESQAIQPLELSRLDILKLAMESEEGRIKAEAERDHAIATKAQIGNKREATSMARLGVANRENAKLREQLGTNTRHATVKAVDAATKRPHAWLPLRKWCTAHGVEPQSVQDPLYGNVKSWPADAWGEVYGIDLQELFGVEVQV